MSPLSNVTNDYKFKRTVSVNMPVRTDFNPNYIEDPNRMYTDIISGKTSVMDLKKVLKA
jgi:hypothetical protein